MQAVTDITYPIVERKDAFNLFLSQLRGALERLPTEEVLLDGKQPAEREKTEEMISKKSGNDEWETCKTTTVRAVCCV